MTFCYATDQRSGPEIRFMRQGGCLPCLPRRFLSKLLGGKATEFLIDNAQQGTGALVKRQ